MPRRPDVIVDESPLDAPSIDVGLRVGWLLRTCRLNSPRTSVHRGDDFGALIGVGSSQVSRWEMRREVVPSAAIEGYERELGMVPGSLRGVVEMTRRTFRQTVPAVPRPVGHDLDEMSELLRPAMEGTPSGIDWLHFADHLHEETPALPLFLAEPVIDRLARELTHALGDGYLTRYEAMARLRSGPYGGVALRRLMALAVAPHTQVPNDLLDVAAECPSTELFDQLVELLLDPRGQVFQAATLGLANMAAIGVPAADMRAAAGRLVEVYDALADDPERHRRMSQLLRNLPVGVLKSSGARLSRPLAPAATLPAPASRDGVAFRVAASIARTVGEELAYADHVLERVLFEALFSPIWTQQYLAGIFLAALPYRQRVADVLDDHRQASDEPLVRRATGELLLVLGGPGALSLAREWVASRNDDETVAGLLALGRHGHDLDTTLLDPAVRRSWPIARRALYAAGMSGSPVLQRWADDVTCSDEVRGGAAWWIAQGPRIEH